MKITSNYIGHWLGDFQLLHHNVKTDAHVADMLDPHRQSGDMCPDSWKRKF